MSQAEFASFLGVERNTVWRWENGWPVSAPYPDLIRLKCPTARPRRAPQRATA